ncbi:MAG: ATP synthase F1 subunit delta [Chloroflexota bacterium]|nr:ATP synthase F1 subunit delta [Chloroflexota bacterium]
MARRDTSARRYAEAAFQTGRADGSLDAWERDMALLGRTLRHAELRALLQHPAVPFPDKERVLRKVLGRGVAPEAVNLVLLMVRRGRPGAIDRMIARFAELLRRERGIVLADVRTALPLDDSQRAKIAARLQTLTGAQVEMDETVDLDLIGGIAVRIGDRLYDASVRSRLARLRARLTAV